MAFESLSEKLSAAFKKLRGKGRLTEADIKEAMREVRLALLEADVSYKVVKDFVKNVSERAVGQNVLDSLTPAQMVIKIVNEELTALMGSENVKLNISSQSPSVVMPRFSKSSLPRTAMAIGVLCSDSSRFWAVTMISSSRAEAPADAVSCAKTAAGVSRLPPASKPNPHDKWRCIFPSPYFLRTDDR